MLLFIPYKNTISFRFLDFNTSHVTVYPNASSCKETLHSISIHLMLLFIHLLLLVQMQLFNFNTSHVTVYRQRNLQRFYNVGFQYISCYCLSPDDNLSTHFFTLFQYISCYCLSNELTPFYIFLRI